MAIESLTLGSNGVSILIKIKDESGPVNLEGATISYWLRNPKGVVSELEGTVTTPNSGECQIELTDLDIPIIGLYEYRIIVQFGDKKYPSFKNRFKVVV